MSQNLPPGIFQRKEGYEIDKKYCPGQGYKTVRLRKVVKSTAKVAIAMLEDMSRAEYNKQVNGHGVDAHPKTWKDGVEAFWKYKGITPEHEDFYQYKILSRYIPSDMPLNEICNDTFEKLREDSERHGLKIDDNGILLKTKGNKKVTANRYISVVRSVLFYCKDYKGTAGNRWVKQNPGLRLDREKQEQRKPWYLTEDEEANLLAELPTHLEKIAKFALHTALRSGEIVNLKWEDLQTMPGIGSLFIIPGDEHKNSEPKPVYLNAVAANIVAQCRGDNDRYVFTYKGKRISKVVRGAWHKACKRAKLYDDSPKAMKRANGQAYYPIMHDLRKLACTRLDNLPMAIDTRQKIMGHTTGNITQDLYTFQYLEPIKKALDMLATCENKLTFLPIAK
tara:strand:- start:577 stop:1755 length:1179 start_codon:yes stop_codon:yes gene_type:complete